MAEKLFIDATGTQMGRLASFVAKQALLGAEIAIVNVEKAIISGNKTDNITKRQERREINQIKPRKGPFYSKCTDRIMKRCVRGMLPDFRLGRGKEALKRVKCYNGLPEEFAKEKLMKVETKVPRKIMTLQELSRRM
jgi:large subunit ribosomal protein L13